jgi:hypothetical protein
MNMHKIAKFHVVPIAMHKLKVSQNHEHPEHSLVAFQHLLHSHLHLPRSRLKMFCLALGPRNGCCDSLLCHWAFWLTFWPQLFCRQAEEKKNEGNTFYGKKDYDSAVRLYTEAIGKQKLTFLELFFNAVINTGYTTSYLQFLGDSFLFWVSHGCSCKLMTSVCSRKW